MLEAQLSSPRKRGHSQQPAIQHNVATPGCHMPEAQLSNHGKNGHSQQCTLHQNQVSQLVCKKRKRSHPIEFQFPPAFWDSLSKIDLTKLAVKELDRRNTQATLSPRQSYVRPDRHTTRPAFTELNKSSQSLKPPAECLYYWGQSDLKRILQIARDGGPDLSHLRGFSERSSPLQPAMSSPRSTSGAPRRTSMSTTRNEPSAKTPKTATIGPYNRNFQQHLIDGGVYPDDWEYDDGRVPPLPANWEKIKQRLTQRRASLSPSRFSDNDFRNFKRANTEALKEKEVATSVIPIIEGHPGDRKCVSGGIPFTNLDNLTDGRLKPGHPDTYHGARPYLLDLRVRDELGDHIIPSTQGNLPIAPNFFLAVKGPDGSEAVAERQANYDGALGARGMRSLQSYRREEPVLVNTASTISSTYYRGTLKMYTIHPIEPTSSESRPEYFMHQLGGWVMTSNPETFRQGATSYRNARDWAKEQRDEAIARANEKVESG